MEKIRYIQRNCTDRNKIEEFLQNTRIGVIGIHTGKYPYSVPVNYIWYRGAIYFHGMGSGKKNELLLQNPLVSFTVFEEYGTVKDPVPCHADTSYMSVMLFGTAVQIEDFEESADVLKQIMEKYMPDFYKSKMPASFVQKYRSSYDNKAVAVYKIVVEEITAKINEALQDDIF